MSVWTDSTSLGAFVYRTAHVGDHAPPPRMVRGHGGLHVPLVGPGGHIPTVEEGMAKLAQFEAHGPAPDAFSFKVPYPAPDGQPASPILDECA
jgi:hypothetical protein